MLSVPYLSQRDPRWKDIPLGTSQNAIGGYGCIITCLTMLANKTQVDETNKLMIEKGAYVQDDITNWIKVPQALPNLKFNYRYWYFDNNIVRDWIYNKKFPVIVQVDAAPIGAPRSDHYVLYIGDQKLVDPWTGTVKPTYAFPDVKGFITYEILSGQDAVREILYGQDSNDVKIQKLQEIFPR